jgi:hypothetical protein
MKKNFTSLLGQLAVALTFVGAAHAETNDKIYLIKPEKIKWGKRNPVSLCNELVMKPKFEITGEGSDLFLNFTFQDQKYTIGNITTDPNKIIFQSSDSQGETESKFILIDGKFENGQYNGTAKVQIKKNTSIVSAKDKKKWVPHKYECEVSYDFKAKPVTVK